MTALRLPKFIAVTGREASGKDVYGEHLKTMGYMHVSAGDVLRERARELGHVDPIPRSVLSKVGDELKRQFGPSPIVESTMQRYNKLADNFPAGLVISGLRRTDELKAFKQCGAVQLWIDADIEKRFANQATRSRGDHQDQASFEESSRREYLGYTQGGLSGVNLKAVEDMSDTKVLNNGSIEEFFVLADKALSSLA